MGPVSEQDPVRPESFCERRHSKDPIPAQHAIFGGGQQRAGEHISPGVESAELQ